MYDKCFIACLDILGFKDLVNAKYQGTQHYVHDEYIIKDRLRRLRENSRILTGANEAKADPKIHSILISDTLLLFSEYDDEASFKYICGITSETICDGMGLAVTNIATPVTPMRFRGAIAWGDFSYDYKTNEFFGPAFIDAYQWEQKQEWIGAILTPTCTDYINDKKWDKSKYGLIEYAAPIKHIIKSGNKCETMIRAQKCLCLDWTHGFACDKVPPDNWLKQLNGDDNDKIKYTVQFYSDLKHQEGGRVSP